jgi:hypothetical protein
MPKQFVDAIESTIDAIIHGRRSNVTTAVNLRNNKEDEYLASDLRRSQSTVVSNALYL